MEEDETKRSKYNAAVAQLYRLDNLWQSAHLHSRSGQLIKWNWDLDKVYAELSDDSEKSEEKKYNLFLKLISKYLQKKSMLYAILLKKEIWLRGMQNKQGKGTAYVDESEDDFE